jgi:hypothetical protein
MSDKEGGGNSDLEDDFQDEAGSQDEDQEMVNIIS